MFTLPLRTRFDGPLPSSRQTWEGYYARRGKCYTSTGAPRGCRYRERKKEISAETRRGITNSRESRESILSPNWIAGPVIWTTYLFPASFLAISSTILGRRSAITLSTMLAIVLASVVEVGAAGADPSAAAAAALAFGAS